MDPATLFATNPFFKYDMDKLCAVCLKKLEPGRIHSLFAIIPRSDPPMKAFKMVSLISDFKIESGPQKICTTCFQNTAAANKFRRICNIAHEHIFNFMEYQQKNNLQLQNEEESEELTHSEIVIKLECETLTEISTEPEIEPESQELTESQQLQRPEQRIKKVKRKFPLNQLKRTSDSKRVKCKVCNKLLMDYYIPIHMRIHTGEKPYSCSKCSKTFATKTSLNIHSVLHSDHKRYICNYCGNAFKLLRHLQCHLKTHTGEKPFKCKVCEKAFTNMSCLKNHMLVHTKEKHFTCEVCAKSFGRKTNLTTHMRSHDGIKKHECHLCGKRFTQAHSMRAHLRLYCPTRKLKQETSIATMDDISVDELYTT